MRSISTLILFTVCLAQQLVAQDKNFTQFYASPQTLNPALTGAFEGKYRISAIYRDQWRHVLENPIKTFAVAADLRFATKAKNVKDDAFGLGLMFFNDKTGVIDFSTTQIAVAMAYHKSLNTNNTQYLTLGIQGGLTQRNVNYASLNFHDEFDGSTGYVMPTGEPLPENNFAFGDFNVGLNYTAKFGRYGRLFTGAAMHHVMQPTISFYGNGATGDKLFRKYSAQISASLPLTKDNRVSLSPRFLADVQGPHMQINTGANFRTAMGQYGSTAVHFGGWVRPVRNSDGFGLDAAVVLLGLEYNNVLVGMSYDLNLRALSANQRQGSFEISVAYLGNYENEEIVCPKF